LGATKSTKTTKDKHAKKVAGDLDIFVLVTFVPSVSFVARPLCAT